jgi:uncharacterized repeat protein (TIGR03803 family)
VAAEIGGANEVGTVFKISPAGVFSVLHTFSAQDQFGHNTDGSGPQSVAVGSDGSVYGAAFEGGTNGNGTVFKLSGLPIILTPSSGAVPRSNFVVLTGLGKPSGTILLRDNDTLLDVIHSDANGDWETVENIGTGTHSITAEDFNDSTQKSAPTVITPNLGVTPPSRIFTDYSRLKKADVIFTRGFRSPQVDLFGLGINTLGVTYSHVALYIGGDSNGTPLIAEAVTAGEAGSLSPVRAAPLELSTVYTDGTRVDFYRSVNALSTTQKDAVVSWTLGTTSRGLPYWNIATDLGKLLWPNLWWNGSLHQPTNVTRFNQAVAALSATTRSTDKYICSTLVWQAYQQAGIDFLSTPNKAHIGGILSGLDPAYVDRIRPFFVFPDTILLSGKLIPVP